MPSKDVAGKEGEREKRYSKTACAEAYGRKSRWVSLTVYTKLCPWTGQSAIGNFFAYLFCWQSKILIIRARHTFNYLALYCLMPKICYYVIVRTPELLAVKGHFCGYP